MRSISSLRSRPLWLVIVMLFVSPMVVSFAENTVGIDVEGDIKFDSALGPRREAIDREFAEQVVLRSRPRILEI
jgi:hypothetical protein